MLPVSDYKRVRKAIVFNSSVVLKTSNYSAAHRDRCDRILSLYLYELGLVHLHNSIAYCVHELAGNARNALLKRIWFHEQGLDLGDRDTYSASVAEFRRAVSAEPQRYLKMLEAGPYDIRFIFAHSRDQIWITVENNTPLLPIEHERIEAKLAAARDFSSMADAYSAMIDFSEGAGLGLAMVLVMLRTLGLSAESLVVGGCSTDERVTRSAILIDRSEVGRVKNTKQEEWATR